MVSAVPYPNALPDRQNHSMNQVTGLLIGFILTLFVYSYLVGDNPLYRLAVHILVGVSATYAALVVLQQVMVPIYHQIRQDPANPDTLLWFVPVFFALLLLLKHLRHVGWLANGSMALLIGIGAAVALTGAITGTLWPQVTAVDTQTPLRGLLVAIFTICTLLTFQFTGRIKPTGEWVQPLWQRGLTTIGRAVLMITFGSLFAGVLNTSLILLIDRLDYFLSQFTQIPPVFPP